MKRYGYIGIVEADSVYEISRNIRHRKEQRKLLASLSSSLIEEKTFRKSASMRIDKLIAELKQGDTIVVCDLKFLAASIDRLLQRLQAIEDKGITIEVLNIKHNSLASHANAIREFNKYIAGSNISKGMRGQNDKKKNNLNAKHTRASIKSWHKQRQIALAKNTGKKTVLELSKEHKVTRQVIYRILGKEEFKGITEPLPRQFELWDLEECKKRVKIHITRKAEFSKVRVSLQNSINVGVYKAKNNISYSKAEADFLAKPENELQEIFTNALEREKHKLDFWNA